MIDIELYPFLDDAREEVKTAMIARSEHVWFVKKSGIPPTDEDRQHLAELTTIENETLENYMFIKKLVQDY